MRLVASWLRHVAAPTRAKHWAKQVVFALLQPENPKIKNKKSVATSVVPALCSKDERGLLFAGPATKSSAGKSQPGSQQWPRSSRAVMSSGAVVTFPRSPKPHEPWPQATKYNARTAVMRTNSSEEVVDLHGWVRTHWLGPSHQEDSQVGEHHPPG